MAILDKFLGRTVSEASGYAIGGAAQRALEPLLQQLTNNAWRVQAELDRTVPPDAVLLAEGVSTGEIAYQKGLDWAKETGFSKDAFDALVAIVDTGPGVALALQLRRRNIITPADFRVALKREGLEQVWIDAIVDIVAVLLSPSELANAVVQGHRPFGDAADDAEKQGISRDDFQTMVDNTGLPPGPETLLAWRRRGILTDDAAVVQGIREGHIKTKYVDEYLKALKPVLSAVEYAGLWLRGWLTEPEAKAGGALTGYDAQQMDLLYLNRGRPATTRQVHIGWARGGRLAEAGSEREAFTKAVKQSNIRPEYEPLLWASRYTYPSAFVVRGLAESGDLTEDETLDALTFNGWEPTLAAKVAKKWAGGGGGGRSAKWADRARSRLFTVTHNEYLDESLDRAAADAALEVVGVPEAERAAVFASWDHERDISRLELTPAQIKKAYKKTLYTEQQAQEALQARGMTQADADTFLQS